MALLHDISMTTIQHFDFPVVQQYPWQQLVEKRQVEWDNVLDATLDQIVSSGYQGWEPCLSSTKDLHRIVNISTKHGLEIKSVCIGGVFHDERVGETKKIFADILPTLASNKIGIIMCNPAPLSWTEKLDKTDEQIRFQTVAFQQVGELCAKHGIKLAYHTHDVEFRLGARELHHMMIHTSHDCVFFCLDTHWAYRGTGNSMLALEDIISLYGKRVVELHLRQSRDGIWSETFEDGDIDYCMVVKELLRQNARPLLVLEQAHEEKTHFSLDVCEANARSLAYVTKVFKPLLGDLS